MRDILVQLLQLQGLDSFQCTLVFTRLAYRDQRQLLQPCAAVSSRTPTGYKPWDSTAHFTEGGHYRIFRASTRGSDRGNVS